MKKMLALLLALLLGLSQAACIRKTTDVQTDAATLKPAENPTEEPASTDVPVTPEPSEAPAEAQVTVDVLCGTWKLAELKGDGSAVDLRVTGIESYLVFRTNHTGVWDWKTKLTEERSSRRWSLTENEVQLTGSETKVSFLYDAESGRLAMKNPYVDSMLNIYYCFYEKTDDELPVFPIPSDVSKTSDGILGVWILQSVEGQAGDREIETVNSMLASDTYAERIQFKVGGAAFFYEDYYHGEEQYLDVCNYVLDQGTGIIRLYGSDIEMREYPFTLDGDELRITIDDWVYSYTRNYASRPAGA